jgi:hypothetical protein
MRSAEHIEQSIRSLHIEAGAERRARTRRDLVAVHGQEKEKTPAFRLLNLGRTLMKHRPRRIAAVVTLAVLLIGVFSLAGGSVAFSQVGKAVNSTLARLKEMIWDIRTGEVASPAPAPAAPTGGTDEPTSDSGIRAVMCAARFFRVPAREQAAWQSLADQGIELIQASSAPETYYATLSGEQSERFEEALATEPVTSPRVLVGEGGEAMIASGIFALAWRPTLSSEGTQIASRFSFHDGETGFEIPHISVEDGGVILVRVRGITPTGEDVLILLTVSVPQAEQLRSL